MRRAAVRAGAAGPRARRRTGRRPARARAAGRTRARWRSAAAVPLTRAAAGLEEMWRCASAPTRAPTRRATSNCSWTRSRCLSSPTVLSTASGSSVSCAYSPTTYGPPNLRSSGRCYLSRDCTAGRRSSTRAARREPCTTRAQSNYFTATSCHSRFTRSPPPPPAKKKELFKWRKGREEALQLDGDRRPGAHRRRHHRAAAPALVDAPPLQSRREQARAAMWSRVAARGANLRRKESGAQTAGFECAVR